MLTPSIAHLPLENQEVTLTPGYLPQLEVDNKVQEIGSSQSHAFNVGHLPLEINSDPESQDMLEEDPNISHLQPRSLFEMEVQEEEMNLPGTLPEVILPQIPSNFLILSITGRLCRGRSPKCLRPDNIDAPKALKSSVCYSH